MDNLQDVRLRHVCLVLGEAVQSAQYIFDLAVPQQLLCELLCNEFRNSNLYTRAVRKRLLNRPCLICFFAWARMESNSTIIFTIISVIKGLKSILV